MKIVHIVATLDESAGGPSRSVPQTCEYLSKLGYEIELIARPSKNPVVVNTSDKFKVKKLSFIGLLFYSFSITKKNTSLIHLQQVWDPYIHILARVARLKGIPYVVTPRGMLEPWIMNNNPLKKKLGMFLYQRKDIQKANAIHVTCELEKKNVRKLGFKNSIYIVPNGIRIDQFPVGLPKKRQNPRKILFLSRIHRKKGIEFLIDAWNQIDNKENWIIEIVGNGNSEYIASLQSKIEGYKLQESIQIKSPVFGKDKIKLYRESSLFILPTFSENFGIVVAEALACYTPVVTTEGTPWEELNLKNAGWWIKIGSKPLVDVLNSVLGISENQLINKGKNGRILIENNYSIESVAKQIDSFYNSILNINVLD